MPDIVSIGECLIELFSEEPIGEAETFTRSLAGDSLNILVAAQRLGSTTGYITRLGDDPFAQYLLSTWRKEGIDVSQVRLVDGFNAVHFVSLLPGGDREFTYYRKGSAPSTMQPSDLDHDYIGEARILHVSGVGQAISDSARATILRAVEVAKERGVSVSYDPNYRHQLWTPQEARNAMEELLPYVDYFLPSAPSDTEVFLGTSDPREAISLAREKGPNTVAVTCGDSGAVVAVGDDVFDVPVYTPGPVVDTTGAGDAFNGAFLHGLLEGRSPRDAATLGSIAAGLKVRGRGALTTMPTGEDVYTAFDALKATARIRGADHGN
ncbi:MAG: sugar kinase [Chloroflexi bacterium]|nr:sugar kinase [Chloroflexota bacterium]